MVAWLSHVALPGAIALAGAAAPVLVLHVALGHAMRARGHPRWRVRDTTLVSPLLAGGMFVGFGALASAAVRAASDAPSTTGAGGSAGVAACAAVAAAAFVVAGFGARAIGKLY